MKVLFLYTELADYTIACLEALNKDSSKVELKVIHFPVNKEAPFTFTFDRLGDFKCITDFKDFRSFYREIEKFGPDKVVCSGWTNSWYLRACWRLRTTATTILCSDNVWKGTPKQHLLSAASRFTIRKIFDKLWIPGTPQISFARMLGYDAGSTLHGFYSCDVDSFREFYQKCQENKRIEFPHRFLCVARYIPAKNYDHLWNAFIRWKQMRNNDWELWCAGTGENYDSRVEHPAIKHLGFVQKQQWQNIISNTGVFVLPSHYEPWGVVVHEFACAGYPLLLSSRVGARSAFLKQENGYAFDPEDCGQLIDCFDRTAGKSDGELLRMSAESYKVSQSITPQHWAHTLLTA